MKWHLSEKTFAVVGSGDIGKAVSKALEEENAKVIMLSRKSENYLDVTDEESFKPYSSWSKMLDGLLYTAGVTIDKPVGLLSLSDWMEVINTNLTGAFLTAKHFYMALKPQSSVVFLSSIVGQWGNIGQAAYSASKAGLEALTKTLAKEWARKGIRVNAISPGLVDTKMTTQLPEPVKQGFIQHNLLKRLAAPEEIANAICFLLSPLSSFITGQNIYVDGGFFIS
ncbi:SDR family NAD(P)-dependent oxidoreductase [Coprothermobacter platensis]|uniref:SDR family NAD(P)-dependent oxidoreductase n=1 Tax=Coprothermobacter platensis TaxID=108819 RepID=UPI0003730FBD|nr:SDR family oxidoreductase [Coprothermobacter platensis]